MRIAYLDTNVYNRLHERGGLNSPEVTAIRAAIGAVSIRIFFSDSNMTELAVAYPKMPDFAIAAFRLAKTICMPRPTRTVPDLLQREARRLQDPSVLLTRYAKQGSKEWTAFLDLWGRWVGGRDSQVLGAAAAQAQRAMKSKYVSLDTVSLEHARRTIQVETNGKLPDGPLPFWAMVAYPGLSECLLKPSLAHYIRSAHLDIDLETLWTRLDECPGLLLNFGTYMVIFMNEVIRGGKPQPNDAFDLLHSTFAAYADVFVTEDQKLRERIEAANFSETTVVGLEGFLEMLQDRQEAHRPCSALGVEER